jgi:glycosyltransferase involved in cell wall biosynthesis
MVAIGRSTRALRLLVALPQFPRDPASGAARTATTIGELVAQAGFVVEVVATTATEGYETLDRTACEELNLVNETGVLSFRDRGVSYALLDTDDAAASGWGERHGAAYDALFDRTMARFRPELLLTYGGSAADFARQRRARAAGARVVFGLYNTRYVTRGLFDHLDAVITPSEFLSRFYRDAIGLRSTPLLTPLWPGDVLATNRQPACLTVVNPSLDKGLIFFASLVAALGKKHSEIPIEVYPSRVSPHFLMQAALVAGIDLAAYSKVTIHPVAPTPAAIYQRARVVLVPSLVEDAAPRVVAEALVNGCPPIGSDRGGIPEMCAKGGFVLPLPPSLDSRSLLPIPAEVMRPWTDLIVLLFRDQEFWRVASERARLAGERHLPPFVAGTYVDFFERLADGQHRRP